MVMTWKGASSGRAACVIGMTLVAATALADAVPPPDGLNATLAASEARYYRNASLFDVGGEENGLFVLKGQTSAAMQLEHDLIGRKRHRYAKRRMHNPRPRPKKWNGRPRPPGGGRPGRPPNRQPSAGQPAGGRGRPCFSVATYDAIDDDVAAIRDSLRSAVARSHFLGGIVRLAAHDFMDFDRFSGGDRMGPDGCYDVNHPNNAGLETIWCRGCELRTLYERKYSGLSRADFWIAAANAVIRQTSVRGALDLKDTFRWGRRDRSVCRGSGERLPEPARCAEVEDVFLRKMGLGWRDAVALLGAHTLGRGDREFSGHHGTWVDNDEEAQVFDKAYYEAMFTNAWRPRNMGRNKQDWTTGRGGDNARMMLNTDMCLVFDIDQNIDRNVPCCTRTEFKYPDGSSRCVNGDAARSRCPMYSRTNTRRQATEAVRDMLGGSISSNNNGPFYIAFARAWRKATTVGQDNLRPLQMTCEFT